MAIRGLVMAIRGLVPVPASASLGATEFWNVWRSRTVGRAI
jgi:hypothetical protein